LRNNKIKVLKKVATSSAIGIIFNRRLEDENIVRANFLVREKNAIHWKSYFDDAFVKECFVAVADICVEIILTTCTPLDVLVVQRLGVFTNLLPILRDRASKFEAFPSTLTKVWMQHTQLNLLC
jgi:hypothetical protein